MRRHGIERPGVVVQFLEAVHELEQRYGLVIEHEDRHGAFVVRPLADGDPEWLLDAYYEARD